MGLNRRYRVAVVGGCGTWGRYYLKAYAEHPDCDVIALVDRSRERRQDFARYFGVPSIYDSAEELFAVDIPDIVSVILPVSQSPGVVIRCAQAGVRVVSCEKPIAVSLAEADKMVRVCREQGTALGCGTAFWEVPNLLDTVNWVREGHIGALTEASIPGGLPREVSGAGCVQLTMLRALTGQEVAWVEGRALPPEPGWAVPPGTDEADIDCPISGRLGLSGGLICEVPEPQSVNCRVLLKGENGRVYLSPPRSVLIRGRGALASPVYHEWLEKGESKDFFTRVVERLMRAFDEGGEALCSGSDYRQALEIAVALKLSARQGQQRIHLPIADRSMKIYPHPYRLTGGDVAGWSSIGYSGPPALPV